MLYYSEIIEETGKLLISSFILDSQDAERQIIYESEAQNLLVLSYVNHNRSYILRNEEN